MSPEAYLILKEFCDARMAAIRITQEESAKRALPLFVIHPATVQAGKSDRANG